MTIYLNSRRVEAGPNEGKIAGHGLAEVEGLPADISVGPAAMNDVEYRHLRRLMHDIRERVRHKIFAALRAWERQLTYAKCQRADL